ncbi:MAG: mannosyl-3-phosphoglycerate phosphatase [Dehalococcoidia bacterium]|nr:mannosyl-3-phosphoglycerate phosphatase [Dehalococcoidia bacterium]
MKLKPVIFTDLDGTLLDLETYTCEKALSSIEDLRKRGIPVVFCSAKTRAEQEIYRRQLKIPDPFIVENGGAIFIPEDYFPFDFDYQKVQDGYRVIVLGISYLEVRRILERICRDNRVKITGFGDLSAEEVSALTGLDVPASHRAKAREYEETINLEGGSGERDRILKLVREAGLNYAAGARFYGIMGPNDKGKAARILMGLFRRKLGDILTIGLGDSPNDIPMLSEVNIPILVQKPGGAWEDVSLPNLRKVKGIGPVGWAAAIGEVFRDCIF